MTIRIVGNPTQGKCRVYADGVEIKGISKIEFEPMVYGEVVVAKLSFISPIIEINTGTDTMDKKPDA